MSIQRPSQKFTFKKREHITSKKTIQELFSRGSSFVFYPFRVLYLPCPEEANTLAPYHQVLISVPKRKIKKAHQRNLLKRRMREAYRLQKELISVEEGTVPYYIAFVYLANDQQPFDKMKEAMRRSLLKLAHKSEES